MEVDWNDTLLWNDSQRTQVASEAGKGEETNSSLRASTGNQLCLHLDFNQ